MAVDPRDLTYGTSDDSRHRDDDSDVEGARVVADYIADMSGQLESMARASHFELLAYLLAMARAEADTITRIPPGGDFRRG